jgi:RNA polymerase sigma-70 factor (ECF subfamily)
MEIDDGARLNASPSRPWASMSPQSTAGRTQTLSPPARLLELIHQLKPLDRQIMLLYLEGEAAEQIADITGFSASNVSTKIHRIKRVLRRRFEEGAGHETQG